MEISHIFGYNKIILFLYISINYISIKQISIKKSPPLIIIYDRTLKPRTFFYIYIHKVSATHNYYYLLYFSVYILQFLCDNCNRARA